MSGNIWTWGIDYKGQPLLDAWWTPGWTSQNHGYIQVPPNAFAAPGFPQNLSYVSITGNYFDTSSNPLSGYLTFWPSSPLTFSMSGTTTYMPQRYAGININVPGLHQAGDSRIYLWYGNLLVSLMATNNINMSPVSFTYHVREHYKGGLQYDITVPASDAASVVDIHSLIIPGSIFPNDENWFEEGQTENRISVPSSSSQYLAVDITAITAGKVFNATLHPVNIAFIAGSNQPQSSDWNPAQWANDQTPYVAEILIGPNGLTLAPGTYQVWAQVVAPPQVPVMPVGWVTIY